MWQMTSLTVPGPRPVLEGGIGGREGGGGVAQGLGIRLFAFAREGGGGLKRLCTRNGPKKFALHFLIL